MMGWVKMGTGEGYKMMMRVFSGRQRMMIMRRKRRKTSFFTRWISARRIMPATSLEKTKDNLQGTTTTELKATKQSTQKTTTKSTETPINSFPVPPSIVSCK